MRISKSIFGGGALLGLSLLSGAILSAPKANADTSATVDLTVNVPAACSLTPANTTLAQTIAPGAAGNIGTANLKAVCNDPSGFAIYAIGYTNNTYGNTDLVTELGAEHSIHTGTGTSASNWNMTIDNAETTGNIPAAIENNFDQASAIPEVYTKIATVISVTDQTIGTNLTADFNAYIAPNQPASTYTGKVKFTLVHPSDAGEPEIPAEPIECPAGYICYAPNNANGGTMNVLDTYSGDMTSTIGYQLAESETEVALIAPNYFREGYGFAGWNTDENGNGINYGPNQVITTGDLSETGLALYSKWIKAEAGVTMQSFDGSAEPYNSANSGTVIALRDTRDGNVYTVARLADGNWWMVENLRLDLSNPDTDISTSNTHYPTSTFLTEINNILNGSDTVLWETCTTYDSACYDQISIGLGNINGNSQPSYNGYSQDMPWYSYGVMYNWYTATAGNGTIDIQGQEAAGDICPNGWRLPNGITFSNLANSLSTTSIRQWLQYPNNIILSGGYSVTAASTRGGDTGLWESSSAINGAYNDKRAYLTSFNYDPDKLVIDNNAARFIGFPVRCLAN